MLKGKTIAVVVPAYNEESQILTVLETMPEFVDRIIVVDDCSRDNTVNIVRDYMSGENARKDWGRIDQQPAPKEWAAPMNRAERMLDKINREEIAKFVPSQVVNDSPETDRVILVRNLENGGVGASIARGYKWCKDYGIDCTAVMAGDGQMDPSELESICLPVVDEGIDYVKGNRLIHRSAWLVIPKVRFVGNSVLSLLTKIASGYWHVSDTQTGYTAISKNALRAIRLHQIYRRYGMPNDMLVKLNIVYCTVREVEIRPVYNVGEQSKMNIKKVIPTISWLLFKSFFKRLYIKYFFRDFHPLFILYHLAFLLGLGLVPVTYAVLVKTTTGEAYPFSILILFALLFISGFQSLLFAMWMDMLDNERLHK